MLQCQVQQHHFIPALELVKVCLAQKSHFNQKDFVIQGHEQGLILSAFNGLSALRIFVPAKMNDHTSSACLPSQHVLEVIKVSGKEISIRQNKSQLVFQSGKTELRVNIKKNDEFPSFPELEKIQLTKVDATQLGICLSQTIGATSKESENIYALTSLAVVSKGNRAMITGCNGHKLINSDLVLDGSINLANQPKLIPKDGAVLIRKLIKFHKTVQWGFGEKQLIISTPASQLVIHLDSGKYPNTQEIINSVSSTDTIKVSQQKLVSALRRAMIFTDEYNSILFLIEQDKILMRSNQNSVGSAIEYVPATYSGVGTVEIPLNPRYVMDFLSLMTPSDTVEIQLTDNKSPVIIRPQGNNSLFSLIMPIKK